VFSPLVLFRAYSSSYCDAIEGFLQFRFWAECDDLGGKQRLTQLDPKPTTCTLHICSNMYQPLNSFMCLACCEAHVQEEQPDAL